MEVVLLVPLVVIALVAGAKIYAKLTTGRCTSRKCMVGKTVIVTGANSGIGMETARDLAGRGARVILACRNMEKAEAARRDIVEDTGNSDVVARWLDLASLASVKEFAEGVLASEQHLDVLVNNAGAVGLRAKRTRDNLQIGMQVNHFGPFLLTNLLLGLLKKSAPSRIIMVSSIAHHISALTVNLLDTEDWFENENVYSNSKLANILMANELARRLQGSYVTVNSLHPGFVSTEIIWRHSGIIPSVWQLLARIFAKTSEEGAQTTVYLAVSNEVEGVSGKYFQDCKEAMTSSKARDHLLAYKLWEKSEELVKLGPDEMHY